MAGRSSGAIGSDPIKQHRQSFAHPEDTLLIYPGHVRGNPVQEERNGGGRRHKTFGVGQGTGHRTLPDHVRQRGVIVKPKPLSNWGAKGRAWADHGTYLQEHSLEGGGQGLGFDKEQDEVRVRRLLGQWQKAGDPYLFRVILSPEKELDLKTFTRRLMEEKVEPALGTKTQWVAIQHDNTKKSHIHLVIRGLDAEGKQLWIDSNYLWGGLRQDARDLTTQMLGLRTQREINQEHEQRVKAPGWTLLDKSISCKLPERVSNERSKRLSPHEVKRLFELKKRGLAAFDKQGQWQLAEQWEEELKEKSREQKKEHDRGTEKEKGREEKERKQQHVRIIDEQEHEHSEEWGR